MRWLLDTNVISEIRHPQGDVVVKRRFAALPAEALFIGAVVFGELVKGVSRLAECERKRNLTLWLAKLESVYGDRILPFNRETARIWGGVVAESEASGISLGMADGQIAATAIQNGLILVTRNVRHFEIPNLRIWNPWDEETPV